MASLTFKSDGQRLISKAPKGCVTGFVLDSTFTEEILFAVYTDGSVKCRVAEIDCDEFFDGSEWRLATHVPATAVYMGYYKTGMRV